MRHPRRSGRKRHLGRWLLACLVLLLGAGGAIAWQTGVAQDVVDHFRDTAPSNESPAVVPPPAGLDLPAPTTEGPVAPRVEAPTAPEVDPKKVTRAVKRWVGDEDLGPRVSVQVADLSSGTVVYAHGPRRFTPASTTKVLTGVAALETMGPEHRFSTTVVRAGPGRIVLVGGGDPYLAGVPTAAGTLPARANVVDLAARTASALKESGRTRIRLDYDTSVFSGPEVNPTWEPSYVPDAVVAPITGLWVDRGVPASGWGREADPAAAATHTFAEALRSHGIQVGPRSKDVRAPAGAEQIAVVHSAPLSQIVERVLDVSDNEAAEVLAHHVGIATSGTGSFAAGAAGVKKTLAELGVATSGLRIHDGSGLSRENLVARDTMLGALRVAAAPDHPELRAVLTGLPVAGFSGSLANRFDTADPAGLGMVRAKTGTLTGVHGLAGLITDRSGAVMVFVAVADRVEVADTLDARADLDNLSAALAGCSCGLTPPASG